MATATPGALTVKHGSGHELARTSPVPANHTHKARPTERSDAVMHLTASFKRMEYSRRNWLWRIRHDDRRLCTSLSPHCSSFERRYETSDGLVAVALWSIGGLALTLLFILLSSGAEFLRLG
jgi:hypothetical protein